MVVPSRATPLGPPFKVDLLALSAAELESLLSSWQQPRYRAAQIREWIYDQGVADFAAMSNLPAALRQRLAEHATVGRLAVAQDQLSKDGTRKRLWELPDGKFIESVLMPYDDHRRTACISSQVGCAMGCTFCATGQMGFARHLSSEEIFEQAAQFALELRARGERLSNVVFMGMGEPFANTGAVLDAARRMVTDLGIGARHITISTVGLAPEIRRFADHCAEEKLQLSLAISLHEASDASRSRIMPVNRRYDLAELLEACKYYVERLGRRITFEWALIEGQNDSVAQARELSKLLRGVKCHVNLIPLNPTRGFRGGPSKNADAFRRELEGQGIPATIRVRRGIDIDAGCGQLADAASKAALRVKTAGESR